MKGINTFALKLIAIIAMVVDHVGMVLFPEVSIFRIIGRIAFPIFAYCIVEGFMHTSDVRKYIMRLSVMALLSEIPFDLAKTGKVIEFDHQNVFFTLALGVIMLTLMLKTTSLFRQLIIVVAILWLSELLRTDYNSMGLLMIFVFYQFRERKAYKIFWVAIINALLMGGNQIYGLLGLIPIAFHNGNQGRRMKAFFYAFYPAHLLILYFVSLIV